MGLFGIDIDFLDEQSNLTAALSAAVVVALAFYTGGASLTAMGFAKGAYVSAAAFTYAATLTTTATLKALSPVPELKGGDQGYQITQRGSTMPHQIIYGKTRIAGGIVFQGTTDNNKYLHTVLAFAGHEVEEFETIYFNDEVLTLSGNDVTAPAKYVGKVKIVKKLGTTTQTAVTTSDLTTTTTVTEQAGLFVVGETYTIVSSGNTDFTGIGAADSNVGTSFIATGVGSGTGIASRQITDTISPPTGWDTNCRLLATAYLYVVLKFDADAFPNGVPEVTAIVKGKKVYDPRTSATAWSDNPALCLRDYITSGKGGDNTTIYNYGLSENIESVDDSLVTIAANVCDYLNYPVLSGDTRFSTNGAFTTNTTPYDALQNLSTAMDGLLWYAQGEWRMKPAYYTDPVLDLNEDDLRSGISLTTRHSRRDNFNVVKGTFRGPESDYQPSDFPQVPILNSATYNELLTADGGQESVIGLQLPFTDNTTEARRIARITLERNRQQLSLQASFGLRAFQVQVGDIVRISNTRLGFTDKEFEVVTWGFGIQGDYDIQVNMSLKEISESVFDEVSDGAVYESDNTTLPSPFDVPSVAIALNQEFRIINEHVTNVLVVDVSATAFERVDYVEVEFKKTTDSTYSVLGTGDLGRFEIIDIETPLAGATDSIVYDVRARAINSFGVKGNFTDSKKTVEADTTGPSAPSTFEKQLSGGTLFFNWTASTDFDLSYYKLWHSTSTTATFGDGSPQVIINKVARPATSVAYPAISGTFFIEPYDKSGNEGTVASVVVLPSELPTLGTSQTDTENPSFAGAKTNVAVATGPDPDELRLSSFATAPSTGTYEFTGYLDTGSTRTVRVSTNLTSTRHHVNASGGLVNWDDIPNNWDTWPNSWDDWSDEDQPYGDFAVAIYVAATNDDPAGSPTWGAWQIAVGELTGRAFKFKAELDSTSNNVSPSISVLKGIVEY